MSYTILYTVHNVLITKEKEKLIRDSCSIEENYLKTTNK